MAENLVIVESPAKAKTIEKYLGKGFLVLSSFGHIRDLSKKKIGVDIEKNFTPNYEIDPRKKKQVTELQKQVSEAKVVWLATDEDREGEAIAWHLYEVLKLKKANSHRITFNEITKDAIKNAIENPREINIALVDAQQARRILDRLVGFELSPVLWKKVKPKLSAGRVQSVTVRLIVEKEREIRAFESVSSYKVSALFSGKDSKGKKFELKTDLQKNFPEAKQANEFLEKCKKSKYNVKEIHIRPATKSPAPPFTTSTLQQEASRKLGFSVSQTMLLAQKLYESGFITYMRTDSVHLSNTAISGAKNEVIDQYGEEFSKTRQFQTKTKGAQEAHEAIRPTSFERHTIGGTSNEKRIYDLIWKRSIASQMAEAQIEKTTISIEISEYKDSLFQAHGEVIRFDGFLKVYRESTDDEGDANENTMLPPMEKGQELERIVITATQKYTQQPYRYTEASLVKKLEELGIGRPSTYAPIISTVQDRGYVEKGDIIGIEKQVEIHTLTDDKIVSSKKKENYGFEKSKLRPTDMGKAVTDFLQNHFPDIMDYQFTASVEKEFDQIAEGNLVWNTMISTFYTQFHPKVINAMDVKEKKVGERLLGNDPVTGLPVYVKIGRFGPFVQLGESQTEEKPRFASLPKGFEMDQVTLEEAMSFLAYPRDLGKINDEPVSVNIGRFGPYVYFEKKYFSLAKTDDPGTITLDRAQELITEKREKDEKSLIISFPEDLEIKVLNGKYGPYISYKKANFKIPKGKPAEQLTYAEAIDIINKGPVKNKRKK
ncbi:MAG: type I DNA topoisomerase [Bacteroidetes bacterium HGW-Bacteroidetes-21]|jgi:DNA topoisomerase-1|nr:MAG: type I DNA topoisomerase [Bacteroidetes bacterium HGW-Bacteroidetes-21]